MKQSENSSGSMRFIEDVQPARARNAVMIGQKTAQERQMVFAPFGDVVEIVARGDAGADDEKQHLRQRMSDPPSLARVLYCRKMVQKTAKARFRPEARPSQRLPESESQMESHNTQWLNDR